MDELAELKKSIDGLGAAMAHLLATVDSARKLIKDLEAENAELKSTLEAEGRHWVTIPLLERRDLLENQ